MMRQGFFDLGQKLPREKVQRKGTTRPQTRQTGCAGCGLEKVCKSPHLAPIGKGASRILVIGEFPGATDDSQGLPFVDKSGVFLETTLNNLGLRMRRDCRLVYAVRCHSPSSQTPVSNQIKECRSYLLEEIQNFKPSVIIPLGIVAIEALLGHRLTGRLNGINESAFIGEQIPDQELGCWICPTYNPNYLFWMEKDKSIESTFISHLKQAIRLTSIPIPTYDWKTHCQCIQNPSEVISFLNTFRPTFLSYDYETTGIKPHREGHKIISAAVSDGSSSVAFPFFTGHKEFIQTWKDILINPAIKKIAHKADFEATWTYVRGSSEHYWPDRIHWDTLLAAHCLNNQKPTGLKFHTYTKFGVLGYDDSAHEFVTGDAPGDDPKSGNRFNLIQKGRLSDILLYNAADAYFTYKLFEYQRIQFQVEQMAGFNLLMDGMDSLIRIQMKGIKVNTSRLQTQKERLSRRIQISEKKILDSDEVQQWKQIERKDFNFNSNVQMSKLLYGIMKYKEPETNKTDEKALEKINSEFTTNLLQYRKFKKIRDTYLAQYEREIIDGVLHPFFNLHTVSTFRSSSDSPNFQNVPKRDYQAKTTIRSLIIPSPGNRLIEYDYKGVEVSISACYNKDPRLIEYVTDPTTDMHRDIATQLFFRNKKEVSKAERQLAKNGFVFPSFYGSTTKEIAPNIWDDMGDDTKAHLADNNIKTLRKFESHVEGIEYDFWHNRFKVYAQWKQKVWGEYTRKGYVDLYTGFRCWGPMKFTEVTNYPIQGSAFHCLLWNLIHVQNLIQKISGRSAIIGQIHDSLVGDIHPDDEKEVDSIVNEWGTKRIREHWDWITVPLQIEKERSEIDGSWDEMNAIGILQKESIE